MKIVSKIKLNNTEYTFEIDERDEIESFFKAITFTNPRLKCDVCSNFDREKFKFDANKDKEGNFYIKVVCRSCGASSGLGKFKDNRGYFWKKYEQFVPKNNTQNNTPQAPVKDKFGNSGGDWTANL
jgi:hypothetical protein